MTRLPKFSVENPVLVGIIMVVVLAGGIYGSFTLVREMFPESRPNQILITAPYPGATPLEVEKGLALRIEEAVKNQEHVDKIVTQINEGLCVVQVTLTRDVRDLDQAVNDFKAAIDTIPRDELPEDAEEIRVQKSEPKLPVISVAVFGDVDEARLKHAAESLRDDLLELPEVSDIKISGTRKSELTVEVRPEKLVEHRLSLAAIAHAIRQSNLDLPGGHVKTVTQNVAIRTLGETDDVRRIADIVLRSTPDGRLVRVRDVARVRDSFEDSDRAGRFNGKPAVNAMIYKTGRQDAIDIATAVKAYVAGKSHQPLRLDWLARLRSALGFPTVAERIYQRAWTDPIPANLTMMTHSNLARFIESRLDLLERNGLWGLAFVFCSLLFFLNWRIAFWVMTGLIFSVGGAIILMNFMGASLNLISMFGLIIVLGLIVDDAIVIGENTFARIENGEDPRTAAIKGAQEVTWPVVVAVGTTVGAFLPLLFVEGRIGDFMGVLPIVVVCSLSASLFEALAILPSHLAKSLRPASADGLQAPRAPWVRRLIDPFRKAERHVLMDLLGKWYEWLLRLSARYRYVTVAAVTALFIIAIGFVQGRRVPFVFLQKMDAETVMCNIDMPVGTPSSRTREALAVVERACLAIPEIKSIWSSVGAQIDADEGGTYTDARSNLAQVIVELKSVEQRTRSSDSIINELRAKSANIPGVNSIVFRSMQGGPAGAAISMEISGKHLEELVESAEKLETRLADYAGVYDIADDYDAGRREVQIELLESARPLGLTTQALASEVRGAFYGLEARTLQRGRDDVDIRVRFPADRRQHIYELESMRVVTALGSAVPLREVARLRSGRSAATIRRVDQRRTVTVTADVDQATANAESIIASLAPDIAQLERDHPGLRVDLTGNKEETRKSLASLRRDFIIAILLIYFMLAALFRSYVQPLIVLTAVPFGLNGAVVGHYLMGYPLTILSMIGLVALTGIVVNDALIMVAFVNDEVASGIDRFEAVIAGGLRRLRPILLTSLTTIAGLAPLMTETSFQARFLIPMAISISFGLGFATVLTLIVVPANYLIVEDIKSALRRFGMLGDSSEPQPA